MAGSWIGSTYSGDATNETVTGGNGPEGIFGGEGSDALYGGGGDDAVNGGVGNDRVFGGAGNDRLNDTGDIPSGFLGAIGVDGLFGGAGDDEIQFQSIDTGDVADGGSGNDLLTVWIRYDGSLLPPGTAVTLAMGPGGIPSLAQLNGINTLSFSNFEYLRFFGSNANEFVTGGAFDDGIYAGAGDDRLFGGAGNDRIDGGTGIQDMDGGDGVDTAGFDVSGLATQVLLTNGANVSLGVMGSVRNFESFDSVTLGSGNNIVNLTQTQSFELKAFGGNNRVTMMNGRLDATTGAGNDIFVTGGAADEIDAGAGNNSARLGAGGDRYLHLDTLDHLGNETVYGEAGNDIITTAAGDDLIYGGNDDDSLSASKGNDQIYGGDGNDRIVGAHGRDTLYGDDGNDFVSSDLDELQGTGSLIEADALYGGLGNDRVRAGLGADLLDGGAGNDMLEYRFLTDSGTLDTFVDTLIGGIGDDTLFASHGFVTLTDGRALEVILAPTTLIKVNGVTVGSATGVEALDARAFGTGNHNLRGGALNDNLMTADGNDQIYGGAGNDNLTTGFGKDSIYAGDGDDQISGVQLGAGDIVSAGDGNDRVSVLIVPLSQVLPAGLNNITGGLGNDTLVIGESDRNIVFNGTAIFADGVKIANATGFEVVVQLGSNMAGTLNGLAGNDSLYGYGGSDTITGNLGDDLLDGGNDNDRIFGGGGNDSLTSGTGADSLYGGDGNDTFALTIDNSANVISGGLGIDQFKLSPLNGPPIVMAGNVATGATVTVAGILQATLTGIEKVVGSGSIANDVLIGGTGNDELYAFSGTDSVITGSGNDSVYMYADAGVDTLSLGSGSDLINFYQTLAGDLTVTLSANTVVQINGTTVATVLSAETLYVTSSQGDDTVTGGALNDTMYLYAGANSGSGLGGDDLISVAIDALADTLVGGTGTDQLALYGGADAFVMNLNTPGHILVKLAGVTVVDATQFEWMTVFGSYNATTGDVLRGRGGNDLFYGGAGNDQVFGGSGNDTIYGGAGSDTLTGGLGNDVFSFYGGSEIAPADNYDQIDGFVSGQDKLDLAPLDALPLVVGNDSFLWIGAGVFTGVAGQLRFEQQTGQNRTLVQGDFQGDGVADFTLELTGLINLLATDINL